MKKFNKIQKFTKANIAKVPEDKAIIYKIKSAKGENLYTGVAGRRRGQDRLLEHKELKREKVPGGTKFHYAQVQNKVQAEQTERQIIRREQPKFNKLNK